MKKFLKIGQLALVVMLLIGLNSCELEKKIRKHFGGKEQLEAQTANAPVAQEPSYKTPEPKVDGVFQVEARIYRIIDNHDGSVTLKATDHIVPMKIEHYDNGHICMPKVAWRCVFRRSQDMNMNVALLQIS